MSSNPLPVCQSNSSHYQNRKPSSASNSKTVYSLCSATFLRRAQDSSRLAIFVDLCAHPDETYAYRTLRKLLLSHYFDLVKLRDEFGCNVFMYSLRYQRYRLFELLLNEATQVISLRQQDKQGNTILHYAVLYGGDCLQIVEKLIEQFKKFSTEIDDRNHYGFTALLLAAFCGRYDIALSLLKKTNASPFVRDHTHLKNVFDYIEIDTNSQQFSNTKAHNQQNYWLHRESTRLRCQLYHSVPGCQEVSCHMAQSHPSKNFFEVILPRIIQDQSDLLRSSILSFQNAKYFDLTLKQFVNHLHQRYPHIANTRFTETSKTNTGEETLYSRDKEDSNKCVHSILNLFDPHIRPKFMSVDIPTQKTPSATKPTITFKRLSSKITTIATFSRVPFDKSYSSFSFVNANKYNNTYNC